MAFKTVLPDISKIVNSNTAIAKLFGKPEVKSALDNFGESNMLRYSNLTDEDIRRYNMKAGGKVKSASARADGIAKRGKTRA